MTDRKNFKGQLENETVLSYFRKHWIKLMPSLFAIPVLLLIVGIGAFYFKPLTQQGSIITGLVLFGFAIVSYLLHRQFMSIFHYFLHTVIITNCRIVEVDKSVYFRDTRNSIDLSKIQDIEKRQNGILENVLDFGSLVMVLSGTHVSVNIDLVPQPDFQFKKIHKVKERMRRERNYRQIYQEPEPSPISPVTPASPTMPLDPFGKKPIPVE